MFPYILFYYETIRPHFVDLTPIADCFQKLKIFIYIFIKLYIFALTYGEPSKRMFFFMSCSPNL